MSAADPKTELYCIYGVPFCFTFYDLSFFAREYVIFNDFVVDRAMSSVCVFIQGEYTRQ